MYEYHGNNDLVAALAIIFGGTVKVACAGIAALGSMAFWDNDMYKYTLDTIRDICAGKSRVVEKVVYIDKDGNEVETEDTKEGEVEE